MGYRKKNNSEGKSISIKPLFWGTLFCLALFIIGAGMHSKREDHRQTLDTRGLPLLGSSNAPVEVVAFEEPKCSNCKTYSLTIFPQLREDFIDKGQVRYSTLMVSFIPGSKLAAEALLAVGAQNSALFFSYLDTIYRFQPPEDVDWAKPKKLLEFAKEASPVIDLTALQRALENGTYAKKVDHNTKYGSQVMAGHLSTPVVYVNGERVEDLSYESVAQAIKEALKEKR